VAIAVALMPPLCTIGITLSRLDLEAASGAALLFATNLVSISLAAAVVFWLMKIHPLSEDAGGVKRRALGQIALSVVLLCAIAVPVALSMRNAWSLERAETDARATVEAAFPGGTMLSETSTAGNEGPLLRVTVATADRPSEVFLRDLAAVIVHDGSYYSRVDISVVSAVSFTSP
jgi:uncharacterized membrane protein